MMRRLVLIAAAALMILGAAEPAFAGGRVYVYTSGGSRYRRPYSTNYSRTRYYPRRYYYYRSYARYRHRRYRRYYYSPRRYYYRRAPVRYYYYGY